MDYAAALTTLAGVLLFDILAGLAVGVAVSIIGMMRRAVRPRCVQLGFDRSAGNGRDGIDSVSPDNYAAPNPSRETIHSVTLDVSGDLIVDTESELHRLMAQQ